jgi:hypothetical protein
MIIYESNIGYQLTKLQGVFAEEKLTVIKVNQSTELQIAICNKTKYSL